MNNVLKKYILENYVLTEETIQLTPGERVMYQSPAKELNMSGRFRFQQNTEFQTGRLLVTNKRVIFNGISTMSMNTKRDAEGRPSIQSKSSGAQSYSFPVGGSTARVQKLSIPEHMASLGLQAPFMKLFGTGYVKISGNGGDRGYSVNNPGGLISIINTLGSTK
jgi:hypothetical protein